MIIHKRKFIALIAVAVIISLGFLGIAASAFLPTLAEEDRPVIIIDAGHGGFDGGAVAKDGTVEKDINLKIALGLERILKFEGFSVVMTRVDDVGTDDVENGSIAVRKKNDLQNRLKLMKKYPDAIYVSIHLNKFTTTSASGAQVFYSPKHKKAADLAQSIQDSIVSLIQPDNKRVIKAGTNGAYLLKFASVPTVIVECGFLSNHLELEKLKSEEYQSKLSFAIAAGIKDYYKCKED